MKPTWFIENVVERVQRLREALGDDCGPGEVDWRAEGAIRSLLREVSDPALVADAFQTIAMLAREEESRRRHGCRERQVRQVCGVR
jgi:hypothetical protein